MSNTISVTNINKVRKIKKNMYIKIKNHYESKYTNISIDTCQKIYNNFDNFNKEVLTQSDIDILKNGIDKNKNPYIKICKDRLKTIVENIIDTKEVDIDNYCYPDYNKNNFSENIINRFEFSIDSLDNQWKIIFEYNPFYHLVSGFRGAFIENSILNANTDILVTMIAILTFLISLFIFNKGYKVIY